MALSKLENVAHQLNEKKKNCETRHAAKIILTKLKIKNPNSILLRQDDVSEVVSFYPLMLTRVNTAIVFLKIFLLSFDSVNVATRSKRRSCDYIVIQDGIIARLQSFKDETVAFVVGINPS